MPNWIVRKNCEYSILIEADNAEDAMKDAHSIDVRDWDTAWSDYEAEKE